MAFQLRVQRVTHIERSGLYILDSIIEHGKVLVGSEGALQSNPSRRIRITGVGIHRANDGSYSIMVAPPDFPLVELEGAVIIGA
jgi:hypothetical protein